LESNRRVSLRSRSRRHCASIHVRHARAICIYGARAATISSCRGRPERRSQDDSRAASSHASNRHRCCRRLRPTKRWRSRPARRRRPTRLCTAFSYASPLRSYAVKNASQGKRVPSGRAAPDHAIEIFMKNKELRSDSERAQSRCHQPDAPGIDPGSARSALGSGLSIRRPIP